MAASDVTRILDELVETLEGKLAETLEGTVAETLEGKVAERRDSGRGDAIDAVLAGPARTTRVKSLREAPEVASFREALTDGLIRADTANRLLRLVQALVEQLV